MITFLVMYLLIHFEFYILGFIFSAELDPRQWFIFKDEQDLLLFAIVIEFILLTITIIAI
jgi:hypothetical protein